MKTKHLFSVGTVLMLAAALTFTGCRKEGTNDNDTTSAADNSLAESNFNDMHQMSDEAAKSGAVSSYKGDVGGILVNSCANITWLDTVNGNITIDFGSSPCLCHDGKYRQGTVYIHWTVGKHYWDQGASISITTNPTDNYYQGHDASSMNHVIGTRTVTNNGNNTQGYPSWTVSDNGKVVKANGNVITRVATITREQIAGTFPLWNTYIYHVSGNASGSHTTASGTTQFTMNITSPLQYEVGCAFHWTKGTFDFTPGTKATRHVDFSYDASHNSTGGCDDVAKVTINSKDYWINF